MATMGRGLFLRSAWPATPRLSGDRAGLLWKNFQNDSAQALWTDWFLTGGNSFVTAASSVIAVQGYAPTVRPRKIVGATNTGTGTTLAVQVPAHQVGDLLILAVSNKNGNTVSADASWGSKAIALAAASAGRPDFSMWTKTVAANASGVSSEPFEYIVSTTSSESYSAAIFVVRGLAYGGNYATQGSSFGSNIIAPSITVSAQSTWLTFFMNEQTMTPPGSGTLLCNLFPAGGFGFVAVENIEQAGGATGTQTATISGSDFLNGISIELVAVQSATAAPSVGAVTVAGFAPTVSAGSGGVDATALPSVGAVTATGAAPTVSAGSSAASNAGTVTVTGLTPSAAAGSGAAAGLGTISVAAAAPSVSTSGTASPGLGAVSVSGAAPTISAGSTASLSVGSVTVAGLAPAATAGASASPSVGAVTVSGFVPSVSAGGSVNATPGAGAVMVTGLAPGVSASSSASPSAGAVSVAGQAPSASAGSSTAASVGAVAVMGYAPTVSAGSGATVSPAAGAVAVAGLAPTVSANLNLAPGTGVVDVAGNAPTITAGAAAAPQAGLVTVVGFAPAVVIGGAQLSISCVYRGLSVEVTYVSLAIAAPYRSLSIPVTWRDPITLEMVHQGLTITTKWRAA